MKNTYIEFNRANWNRLMALGYESRYNRTFKQHERCSPDYLLLDSNEKIDTYYWAGKERLEKLGYSPMETEIHQSRSLRTTSTLRRV